MIHAIFKEIQSDLQKLASPARQYSMQQFFKHEIQCYGISNPQCQEIGKRYIHLLKNTPHSQILELSDLLFQTHIHEACLVACQLVYATKKQFTIDHFPIFESWINNHVSNWAVCDTFCNKVMGEMIFKFPQLIPQIKEWAISDNLWMRRASAVSFIYPAKKKFAIADQFDIALVLLEDREDMVQKGYGWMLKVISQSFPEDVFQFVQTYKSRMPRTALRYAIEKLDDSMRIVAMQK